MTVVIRNKLASPYFLGFVTEKAQKIFENRNIMVQHLQSGTYEINATTLDEGVKEIATKIIADPSFIGDMPQATAEAENSIIEYDLASLIESYESNESWPVELGYVEEHEVTARAYMRWDNTADWYVCHNASDDFELMHATQLSNIIECGEPCIRYGYKKIEQCFGGDYVFGEDDFV